MTKIFENGTVQTANGNEMLSNVSSKSFYMNEDSYKKILEGLFLLSSENPDQYKDLAFHMNRSFKLMEYVLLEGKTEVVDEMRYHLRRAAGIIQTADHAQRDALGDGFATKNFGVSFSRKAYEKADESGKAKINFVARQLVCAFDDAHNLSNSEYLLRIEAERRAR